MQEQLQENLCKSTEKAGVRRRVGQRGRVWVCVCGGGMCVCVRRGLEITQLCQIVVRRRVENCEGQTVEESRERGEEDASGMMYESSDSI